MRLVTFSGPPSSGKTSVIKRTLAYMREQGSNPAVVKFDCLYTDDDQLYAQMGIPVKKGLSGPLCPDHYFISNIEEVFDWARKEGHDLLISESAGLCNRCSPYIREIPAVCVIDNLSGINTPKKIGPMLTMADIIVITKGEIVSQAEREVFALKVRQVNSRAAVIHVNGLTGQGCFELARLLRESDQELMSLEGTRLRYSMPSALCSYCLGEKRVGKEYQLGNTRAIDLDRGEEDA